MDDGEDAAPPARAQRHRVTSDDVLRGPEAGAVSAALRRQGWASHTSVARELACWKWLAREVTAYDATIDDYTNDLCSRDYLARAIELASPPLRDALVEHVDAADRRFREGTVPDDEGLIGYYCRVEEHHGWWWRVRPATGPLATSLEREH